MLRMFSSLLLLGAFAVTPKLANADSKGAAGRIVEVQVNAQGSDNHALYRGAVKVRSGKKKAFTYATYKWGGSTCPGKDLTADQVAVLSEALANRSRVSLIPRFKNGQGGNKCLVSFSLATPKIAGNEGPS